MSQPYLGSVEQRAEALAVGAADGLRHVGLELDLVGEQAVVLVVSEASHVLWAVGDHGLVDLVEVWDATKKEIKKNTLRGEGDEAQPAGRWQGERAGRVSLCGRKLLLS